MITFFLSVFIICFHISLAQNVTSEDCLILQLEGTENRHRCGSQCQNDLDSCFKDTYKACRDSCSKASNIPTDECVQDCVTHVLYQCLDRHRSCNSECDNEMNTPLFESGCLKRTNFKNRQTQQTTQKS